MYRSPTHGNRYAAWVSFFLDKHRSHQPWPSCRDFSALMFGTSSPEPQRAALSSVYFAVCTSIVGNLPTCSVSPIDGVACALLAGQWSVKHSTNALPADLRRTTKDERRTTKRTTGNAGKSLQLSIATLWPQHALSYQPPLRPFTKPTRFSITPSSASFSFTPSSRRINQYSNTPLACPLMSSRVTTCARSSSSSMFANASYVVEHNSAAALRSKSGGGGGPLSRV